MTEEDDISYVDKLITLENGSILIGRVLIDPKFSKEQSISIYRPFEIYDDNVQVYMRKWVPAAVDDIYQIPTIKIINISNPTKDFVDYFNEIVTQEYNNSYFTDNINVGDEDESEYQMIDEEKKKLH